ncbi:hypothetical protein G9C85_03390 [Halorubellus sp. JP-L1]|uniref:hypothetical protein n=1 Tax=Halorubellus sp. JP-L1 TaxID=2715753 RepID=UPI00140BC3FA|nr:hypothetical protein [Halorubellus sp. JP-L1]NHN40680.1 hypothetical protein [Halorubellus sp. JP-L1]
MFTRPLSTLASTTGVVAVIGVLYLVSQRPTALQELLSAESTTAGQVLALFPPIYVVVPGVVLIAVVWNAGRVWSGVRRDMGWNRYGRNR